MSSYDTLIQMLTYCRPASSDTEEAFIDRFIRPLNVHEDEAGNLIRLVGDPNPTILWSCHTDTVHRDDGIQRIKIADGVVSLHKKEKHSNCLGGDDTGGVWLMTEMIKAKVPGLYIFHRGEEIEGVGSGFIAKHTPQLLEGIKCAIALDRKGYDSVITHQSWTRCCSEAFAKSLGDLVDMKKDDSGLFTDTANYTDLIGECTNLSIGYFDNHSTAEKVDSWFLMELRDKLVHADWSSLVFERQPGEIDPADNWHGGYSVYSSKSRYSRMDRDDMEFIITEYPEMVADILMEYGVTVDDLRERIFGDYGQVVGQV